MSRATNNRLSPTGARQLRLGTMPAGVDTSEVGGAAFFSYCMGADARAHARRDAIKRAAAMLRRAQTRGEDVYAPALVLCQRLGVACEDLGRLVLALEGPGPDRFSTLRRARYDALDDVFDRLAADGDALRAALRVPTPEALPKGDEALRAALVALADATFRHWATQWAKCADGWDLLRAVSKGMRHGAPLIPRELIVEPPGAGSLRQGLGDRFDRWVLVTRSVAQFDERDVATSYQAADLSDRTLAHARQAGLDAIALAREIASAHVFRSQEHATLVFSQEFLGRVTPTQRRRLREHFRV